MLVHEPLDDAVRLVSQLVQEPFGLSEAARDQLRRGDLAPVRRAQGRDDDEDAVVGEPPAVAEGDVVPDVPDPEPVDERDTRLHAVDETSAAARELDDRAVVGDEDPLLGDASPRASFACAAS